MVQIPSHEYDANFCNQALACPLLMPLAEEGWFREEETFLIVKKNLAKKNLLRAVKDSLRLFIVTDNPARFKKVGELYLERVIPYVRLVWA